MCDFLVIAQPWRVEFVKRGVTVAPQPAVMGATRGGPSLPRWCGTGCHSLPSLPGVAGSRARGPATRLVGQLLVRPSTVVRTAVNLPAFEQVPFDTGRGVANLNAGPGEAVADLVGRREVRRLASPGA